MRQATRIEMLGDIVRDLIGVARMGAKIVGDVLDLTVALEGRVDVLERTVTRNNAEDEEIRADLVRFVDDQFEMVLVRGLCRELQEAGLGSVAVSEIWAAVDKIMAGSEVRNFIASEAAREAARVIAEESVE